jgi:hypothetical protein
LDCWRDLNSLPIRIDGSQLRSAKSARLHFTFDTAQLYIKIYILFEVEKTDVFLKWLRGLNDVRAVARIQIRIDRLSLGNMGDVKAVGEGISELRIIMVRATGSISRRRAKSLCCYDAVETSFHKPPTLKLQNVWQRICNMALKTTTWDSAKLLESPDAGMTRDAVYKALSRDGNPTLSTLSKVMNAMGLQLSAKAVSALS